MTKHDCKQGTTIKFLIGAIALFLTLVGFATVRADKASEKASSALEKVGEIEVIKNDVQWIKKHLENRSD